MFKFLFKRKKKEICFFVSIGAGDNQLPLIRAAKQLGLQVIAIDQNSNASGFQSADIRIQESIENTDEIYTKLQELLLNGSIVSIMTRSFGTATQTVAKLCDRTGLSNIPVDIIDDMMSKKGLKKIFQNNEIPTAKSFQVSRSKRKAYQYPVVVKPVAGHAKQGVQLIDSEILLAKYEKDNKTEFIIEEYIAGEEIIAFGIVCEGRFYLYEISDKITTEAPYFCDLMHISPSKTNTRYAEIRAIGQSIADAAKIANSPLFFEMRIGKDNNFYVIEAAPEFGGEYIAEYMIPATTGYNIFKDAIQASMKAFPLFPQQYRSRESVVIKYLTAPKKGLVRSISPLPKKLPGLIFSRIFIQVGDTVIPPKNNHDRIGIIAVSAKNRELALQRIQEYSDRLTIEIS